MTSDLAEELLQQWCRDVWLMWRQAGGPSLRRLSDRVGLSKSQVGAILNGDIRRLPDWEVFRGLIESFLRHARERDRLRHISLSTGVEEFWRPRYAMLEHALRPGQRPVSRGLRPHVRASRAKRMPPDERSGDAIRPASSRAARPAPHQLPPVVPHFTARHDEQVILAGLTERSDAVVVAVIDGMAGIGKTTPVL